MKETQEKSRVSSRKRKPISEISKNKTMLQENSNTGITLIALVVTIVVLLILAGITINMIFGNGGIFKVAGDAANAWNEATVNEQENLNSLADQIGNLVNGQVGGGSGTKPEEPTPIPPADGSFSKEKGVNTPDLKDGELTPVKWVEEPEDSGTYTMKTTTADDPEWYSYTGAEKKWANATTSDGSMWVWVPRYAYQISTNYHTNNTTGGNINIEFLKGTTNEGATGKTIVEYNTNTTSNFTKFPNGYVIHPGFEYSTTAEGLWVAKFEASRNNATSGSVGSENTIKIQPGVQSWRNITVNDIYTTCLNYDSNTLGNANLNSHMMKNSEWGAVAYLAQSSYGKNAEVWINPNQNYLTGHAGSGPSVRQTTSTSAYNTGNGPQASTTGNVYGVYDMSGCSYEYTATYVANNNGSLTSYGSSLVNGANHTKDVYTSSGDTQQGNYNANASKYGDAVYETSNNYQTSRDSWYGNYSSFPYSTNPFFLRGGDYGDMSSAGLFFFAYGNGSVNSDRGFRPVLVTL